MATKVKGINEDVESFPKRLILLRSLKNMKGQDIAKKMGVSGTVYSSWENGNHLPRGENYAKLAQIFDIPVQVLTGKIPPNKTIEEYIKEQISRKFLAILTDTDLRVKTDLQGAINKAYKTDFSLIASCQEEYDQNRVFLYRITDNSMSRKSGQTINRGMTAIMVNEPNLKILINKVVLIATGREKAKLRELGIKGKSLILTPWNDDFETEIIDTETTPCNIFGYVKLTYTEYN